MFTENDLKYCNGCMACSNICPARCIEMTVDADGFWYPSVDETRCIQCGKCKATCPVVSGYKTEDDKRIAYAAINQDIQTRLHSSSGGVFPALAQEIISQGGIVFGAGFDEAGQVVHMAVEHIGEIAKLCGSKYVQSYIGDSYQKVKTLLQLGKRVMFSGTPCQIGGLKAYLDQDYEKLICLDIACHGVPSPLVWKQYISFRTKKERAELKQISFRDKKYGWKQFSMAFEYANGKRYVGESGLDLYLRMFINNYSLRPSCYSCRFKGLERQADITLADYWGVWNVEQDMDDDLGTSLVVIHSAKGEQLWQEVLPKFRVKKTDLEKAVSYNSAILRSVPCPQGRSMFFDTIREQGFCARLEKFHPMGILRKLRHWHRIKKRGDLKEMEYE